MLMPLSRAKSAWAAYCDACLVGSPVVDADGPLFARAWAVEKLRALGWTHVAPPDLPAKGRVFAEGAWTGETFCFDCARRAKLARDAREELRVR